MRNVNYAYSDTAREARAVEVLAVGIADQDYVSLEWILASARWRLARARSSQEAIRFLRHDPVGVVVVPEELPAPTWRELVGRLPDLSSPPHLAMITNGRDVESWAGALNRGADCVIGRPLETAEVTHVIGLAWLLWSEQPGTYRSRGAAFWQPTDAA